MRASHAFLWENDEMIQTSEAIKRLVSLEWSYFTSVHNKNGRAACQDNQKTFSVMRVAQASNWSKELVDCWVRDLIAFKQQNRNPMAEKYARMEQGVDPDSYAEIELYLPEVSPEVEGLSASIAHQMGVWSDEFSRQYPSVAKLGRPSYSEDDSLGRISTETYCRCELMSFSVQTLRTYNSLVKRYLENGTNFYTRTLATTVELLGYASLEAAERAAAFQAR